jgi:ribosomal protein S18 acetylase RimI-like enzyme
MTQVRPALIADAAAIARIDVECWRASYAGILPDKYLIGLTEAERRRVWAHYTARHPGDVVVAADATGRVRGFGNCGRARELDGRFIGEVFTLYVAPDHQGNGLGRGLLLGLFARLLRRKLGSAVIWVLRDNPSRFFYERLGGKLAGHRPIEIAGATVAASAYGWLDLAAVLKTQARTGDRLSGES